MQKLAKTLDDGFLQVFLGTNETWALASGFEWTEVELGWDNQYYLPGTAPSQPVEEGEGPC